METKTHDTIQATQELDQWAEQIKALEKKIDEAAEDRRDKLKEQLRELETKQRALKKSLHDVADEGETSDWDKVRAEFEQSMKSFRSFAEEVYRSVTNA